MPRIKENFKIISELLSDKDIDYQRISDITYALANEKDAFGNKIGTGRASGNRFESALRYALSKSCHDVNKSPAKCNYDITDCGFNVQVKRYLPGLAQASTLAGFTYFTDLKKLYNSRKKEIEISGTEIKKYFEQYNLPIDFMMVQDNETGKTEYYLFCIEDIAIKTTKLAYHLGKNADSIRMFDKDNNFIMEIKDGENPQSNCFNRGVWVNTKWLSNNVKPIISNVANRDININQLLFGY